MLVGTLLNDDEPLTVDQILDERRAKNTNVRYCLFLKKKKSCCNPLDAAAARRLHFRLCILLTRHQPFTPLSPSCCPFSFACEVVLLVFPCSSLHMGTWPSSLLASGSSESAKEVEWVRDIRVDQKDRTHLEGAQ